MQITSNFSVTKLFASKNISISIIDDSGLKQTFILKVKTIRDLLEDIEWGGALSILCMGVDDWGKIIPVVQSEPIDYLTLVLFELGKYKQYNEFATSLTKYLEELFPGFEMDFKAKQMRVNNITITSEI